MKKGTTILLKIAGLTCWESPVHGAKKLLAELPSDDGMRPKHKLATETGTVEFGTLTDVDCGGVAETGGE